MRLLYTHAHPQLQLVMGLRVKVGGFQTTTMEAMMTVTGTTMEATAAMTTTGNDIALFTAPFTMLPHMHMHPAVFLFSAFA